MSWLVHQWQEGQLAGLESCPVSSAVSQGRLLFSPSGLWLQPFLELQDSGQWRETADDGGVMAGNDGSWWGNGLEMAGDGGRWQPMTGQWRANVGDGRQMIGAVFLTSHQLLHQGETAVAVAEARVLQGPTRMQLLTRADITHLCGCRLVEGPPPSQISVLTRCLSASA